MPKSRRSATLTRQAIIALDLGGTKLASALFADDGQPIGQRAVSLDHRQSKAVGELIVGEVRRLERAAAKRGMEVRSVGVCVPGIAHRRTGRVWAPNIPGWDDYPLRAEILDGIVNSDATVVVESDRIASILGEAWQGAARGCRDAVFLAVGTGIGAGILTGGRVLRGAHDIAGAIGWFALDRPFRSEYVDCGCFESHASGDGLAKVATRLLAERKGYRGRLRAKRHITAHDVFEAHEHDDEIAKEVLGQAIEFWGMASANLISLFNPEMLIFGGGVFGPATRFLDAIAAEARRWAQPIAMERVKFAASQLGGDAALYGAGYLALKRRVPR